MHQSELTFDAATRTARLKPGAGPPHSNALLWARRGFRPTILLELVQLLPQSWPMKISIGSDHAGFRYKEKIKGMLKEMGHEVLDFGTDSEEPCDYPLFIRPAAEAVARGNAERGIVLGGSGNGEAITANRIAGIRCGLCWNEQVAKWHRLHNDGNVLSLGQRTISEEEALHIVRVWLETPFEGGRHVRRIYLIDHPEAAVAS